MKKYIIAGLLAAAMILPAAGCGALPAAYIEQTSEASIVDTETAAPGPAAEERIVVQLDDSAEKNAVSVSANGTVKVTPDVAYTTVGVVTQKRKMQDAQEANRELMNAVVTALKEAGLTENDVRTTNYSVYPVYDYSGDTSRIASFEVNNTVELTIRDTEKVGNILDIAATAGANTSYSVRFDVLDKEPFYNQALTAAMESARDKADTLAAAGGFAVKGVLNVSEGYTSYDIVREYPAAEESALRDTYVSAGDLDVTANVSVSYEIE